MNPQLKQRQWDEVEEQEDNRMQLNINDLQHDRCWTGSYAVSHSALWLLSPNSLDQRQQSCDRKRCLCGHQKNPLFFYMESAPFCAVVSHVHLAHFFPLKELPPCHAGEHLSAKWPVLVFWTVLSEELVRCALLPATYPGLMRLQPVHQEHGKWNLKGKRESSSIADIQNI